MAVKTHNALGLRVIPPKGKSVVEYVGRFAGGSTTATLDTARSSQGLTVAHAGADGEYTVTLPGKGAMTFLGASASVIDAAGELIGVVNVKSASETARTVTFEHFEDITTTHSTLTAQDLAATEDMFVRILVAQL